MLYIETFRIILNPSSAVMPGYFLKTSKQI